MGTPIPGRTGSTRSTELNALNEIIRKLTDVRNAISNSGGSGSATLSEQQSQTTLLTNIDTNTVNLEALLSVLVSNTDNVESILTAISNILDGANSPSQLELTNPNAEIITGFKELSFVCSGTISVSLDGNTIVYPYTLGSSTILGATIKTDTVTLNAVQFDGTGTVLINIMQ
jgi:hypothetical protein